MKNKMSENVNKNNMKKFNRKYFKIGEFKLGELKKKFKEIQKITGPKIPIDIKPISIDETIEEEQEKEMKKFDASISPITMSQLKHDPRLSRNIHDFDMTSRCLSQQTLSRAPDQSPSILKTLFGFKEGKFGETQFDSPRLSTFRQRDSIFSNNFFERRNRDTVMTHRRSQLFRIKTSIKQPKMFRLNRKKKLQDLIKANSKLFKIKPIDEKEIKMQ